MTPEGEALARAIYGDRAGVSSARRRGEKAERSPRPAAKAEPKPAARKAKPIPVSPWPKPPAGVCSWCGRGWAQHAMTEARHHRKFIDEGKENPLDDEDD